MKMWTKQSFLKNLFYTILETGLASRLEKSFSSAEAKIKPSHVSLVQFSYKEF